MDEDSNSTDSLTRRLKERLRWEEHTDWITHKVPEWRRCVFLLLLMLPCLLFGALSVRYGMGCYIGEVPEDVEEARKEARGACPLAMYDGGALTIALTGCLFLLLALLCVLATGVLVFQQHRSMRHEYYEPTTLEDRDVCDDTEKTYLVYDEKAGVQVI